MDEVVDGLFVGTAEDAGNQALTGEYDIEVIVSLTHESPDDWFPSDLMVVRLPMKDGPQNDQQIFEQAVNRVLSRLRAGDKILIHCSAGASRSPAVAATALALYNEVGLETAFEQVTNRRNAADPHEAIIRQAARVYTQHRE
jgi:atypical dual specificity phosphatase